MIVGGATRALRGETWCGDAWACRDLGADVLVGLVDGLGHGRDAALAAEAALAVLAQAEERAPERLLMRIDGTIRPTRGVAAAVAGIDPVGRQLALASVGNVRVALFGERRVHVDAMPGIVGAGIRLPRPIVLDWADRDLLVLWTDGVDARLDLDRAMLRLKHEPEALARRLLDDFATGTDDAGVVCVLLEGARP